MKKQMIREENKVLRPSKVEAEHSEPTAENTSTHEQGAVASLHRNIGNQAVQRLIAQRDGQEPTALDQETAGRIDQARGGGQALDASVQTQMGETMGADLSGVRVHTSSESDSLNRQLGAKAFTTGQDVFFRDGAYAPHSTDGQKLIAHELAHVVQQGSGAVSNPGSGLKVNAPGDAYEHEADTTADAVMDTSSNSASAQMQEDEELQMQEDEELQMQEDEELQMQEEEEAEEEEPLQTQREADAGALVQMQPLEEEEEMLQPQPLEEEEEMLQPQSEAEQGEGFTPA